MSKLRQLISISALCMFAMTFISFNGKVFAIENVVSTDQINDNTFKAVKESVNRFDIAGLRQHLDAVQAKKSELIDLQRSFNAFPATSKINLTLKDIDIPTVLRIIAKEGGKNIVIDESVCGYINAELKNISLNEAMKTILVSQELEARVDGNTIFVASRPVMSKKGLNRKYIKAFKLNNSNAVEVAQILEASVFNKGYKVTESAAVATAMQAVETAKDTSARSEQSTVGQSSLTSTKQIQGRVEEIAPGSGFGDAKILAGELAIQSNKASTKAISVDNNDGGAIVIPDTRTNSILVSGLKEDISLARSAIEYLDKPLKQVAIEVSLIELTKEDTNNFGLSLGGHGGKFDGGFNSSDKNTLHGLTSDVNQNVISFQNLETLSDDIYIRLNALIQNNKAKLLANPTVVALDNTEALIKITDQVVSKMEVIVSDTNTTYNTTLADVGIVLNILPKIGDNGSVNMRIRPSITTPLAEKAIGGGSYGYVTPISTREVIIQDVRVKTGETLAIAGLLKDLNTQEVGKIPFLGELPLIGAAFTSKTNTTQKTELVILITPKIIGDTEL